MKKPHTYLDTVLEVSQRLSLPAFRNLIDGVQGIYCCRVVRWDHAAFEAVWTQLTAAERASMIAYVYAQMPVHKIPGGGT